MSDYPVTAFPTTEANYLNENVRTEGMELRDYFAAQVMSSLMQGMSPENFERLARRAYQMADAMMRARQ